MPKVISKDGTEIAYETKGEGRAVILVDGALCYRGFGPMPRLSELLAPDFKVYTYDRRGRGESGDSARGATDHIFDLAVEDIEALVQATGESALLFGSSIEGMRGSPMWPTVEAVAPTLAYDAAAIGADWSEPVRRAAQVTSPALVMNGTVVPFMADTAAALARALPHARQRTLEGQSHDVNLDVLAPELAAFFSH